MLDGGGGGGSWLRAILVLNFGQSQAEQKVKILQSINNINIKKSTN